MAWNEPGGQDPWGRKRDSNNQGPPDLDEVLRNFQNRLKGLFGGGGAGSGSGGGAVGGPASPLGIALLIGLLLVVWLLSGFYIVDPAERGVVLRFGQFERITTEGPRWHMPWPIERVEKVNVDEVRSTRTQALMLTRDENIVDVDITVQFRVADAEAYLFNVREPDNTLRDVMISAVREVVGKSDMEFVLGAGRREIADQTGELAQRLVDLYEAGLRVVSVNLQDAQPPEPVQPAFEDAIKAREDQERVINEARAYANDVVPRARGAGARIQEEAMGYRDALVARAEGESDRFLALLEQYLLAPDVTRERLYIETMQMVMGNSQRVLVRTGDSSNVLYLPLDKMIGDRGRASRVDPDTFQPVPRPGESGLTGGSRQDQRSRERR